LKNKLGGQGSERPQKDKQVLLQKIGVEKRTIGKIGGKKKKE